MPDEKLTKNDIQEIKKEINDAEGALNELEKQEAILEDRKKELIKELKKLDIEKSEQIKPTLESLNNKITDHSARIKEDLDKVKEILSNTLEDE